MGESGVASTEGGGNTAGRTCPVATVSEIGTAPALGPNQRSKVTKAKRKKSGKRCAMCNREFWMELREDGKFRTICVMSDWTGARYCFPGEGCFK